MRAITRALVLVCAASVALSAAASEDSLSSARDLYAAAAYEDALGVLDRIRTGEKQSPEMPAIDQYRALCLLALGRTADAEQAIEDLIAADPFFQLSADVSPRVRSAFTDVRRRMLPEIAQMRYTTAKTAFDRKDWSTAEKGFKQVLAVLADPEIGAAASQPPLADIRMLAAGFRDLSATAALPPPLPSVPTPEPLPPKVPVVAVAQIYGPDDASVVPPGVVRQDMPPFEYQLLVPPPPGALEIVIDERGAVESATIRKSILAKYDARLIDATHSWQYRPAMLNGVPVKYRKIVNISVKR